MPTSYKLTEKKLWLKISEYTQNLAYSVKILNQRLKFLEPWFICEGGATFCGSFLYILNMEAFNKLVLNKSQHSWSRAFSILPSFQSSCFHVVTFHALCAFVLKIKTRREKLSWGKIERWSQVTWSETIWVLQLYCERGSEQQEKQKCGEWGRREAALYLLSVINV